MRLDQLLVDQELAPSRTRAQYLITAGRVTVDGVTIRKSAQKISAQQQVTLVKLSPGQDPDYVSRGALKLIAALDTFKIDPQDRICLDIGAGTGGFTEVLLRRGATKIHAVDVGTGQLHSSLQSEPRVISHEQQNAKTLTDRIIPEPIDLIVADVSFISLTKALTTPLGFCRAGAYLVFLIKPQFEMGRRFIGKGGRVTASMDEVENMLGGIRRWLLGQGWHVLGLVPSPIPGGDGNREYLIGAINNA